MCCRIERQTPNIDEFIVSLSMKERCGFFCIYAAFFFCATVATPSPEWVLPPASTHSILGWYDGSEWFKPPDIRARDEMLNNYEVQPAVNRLKGCDEAFCFA